MKDTYLKLLGANLRRHREVRGMSQTDLGTLAGYGGESIRTTISKIESGQRDIPASKIAALAKALGTTPGDLIDCVPPASALSPDEQDLLDLFRRLNAEGRRAVLSYAEFAQMQYAEKNNPVSGMEAG